MRRSLGRLLTVAALSVALGACGGPPGAPARVVIPSGASFRVAAESLSRAGIIGQPRFFRAYASIGGRDRDLKAGTYVFRPGTSWGELIDALTAGRGLVHTFTIPEGYALSSIIPLIARRMELSEDSIVAAVGDTAMRRRLDVPTPTLEGYLFPATYTFPAGASARDIVGTMVERFEQVWKPEWNAQLQLLALSRHDVMALAAIVEKEARLPEERAVISAVYHNRLRVGMPLQADPTVQYALGRHVERVLYKDLEVDSRYNTYRHPGLPPGPIASPGEPSIRAALFPADVPFLFFVAHPDGHHEFRRTFREHSAAIKKIRAEVRAEKKLPQ